MGASGRARGGEPPRLPPHHAGAGAPRAPPRGDPGNRGARCDAGDPWCTTYLHPDQARGWGEIASALLGAPTLLNAHLAFSQPDAAAARVVYEPLISIAP